MTSNTVQENYEVESNIRPDRPEKDIVIDTILFATEEEIDASIKESTRETDTITIRRRIQKIECLTLVPTLEPTNWQQWCESIQNLIQLTDTSAAFLLNPPRNKALTIWKTWWATLLREAAPHVQTALDDRPRDMLSKIIAKTKINQKMNVVYRFWNFRPSNNISVQTYVKEFVNRLQDLSDHSFVIPGIKAQMRLLLLYHVNRMDPELSGRCREFSFDDTISECLRWGSSTPPKSTAPSANPTACSFCQHPCHKVENCRKKKKADKQTL